MSEEKHEVVSIHIRGVYVMVCPSLALAECGATEAEALAAIDAAVGEWKAEHDG
jgi:hypothetical protein